LAVTLAVAAALAVYAAAMAAALSVAVSVVVVVVVVVARFYWPQILELQSQVAADFTRPVVSVILFLLGGNTMQEVAARYVCLHQP
jgi:hypothetical protein